MAEIETRRLAEGVELVELARPHKMNAVTLAMWRSLADIFEGLALDRSVKVVVMAGAGGHFSAGADIAEFAEVRKDAVSGARYGSAVERATAAIAGAPQPVLAAISGNCLGGGLELALACDFRIADANARGGITAARRGIVYGLDATRRLVDVVGKTMAKHILFTGAHVHAEEGYRIGLFDRLADGDPVQDALAYAETLKASAPLSVAAAKLAIEAVAAGRIETVAEAHAARAAAALDSEDFREATRAFAEKRPPVFRGR